MQKNRVIRRCSALHALAGAAACGLAASAASGQATQRAVFVANNGNLEGSVTSFTVNADGSLAFVQKLITGQTNSSSNPVPGTNAYAISLTPNGRYLAVSHATSASVVEEITLIEVGPDASLEIAALLQTPDSPLDLDWISDTLLAVTLTNISAPNKVIMYRFDPVALTLTEIDREDTGLFCASITTHPSGELLYVGDSTGRQVTGFRINEDGTLDNVYGIGTVAYPLNGGVTPDGSKAYFAGGISAGRHAVEGFSIDTTTGALNPLGNSPFTSPDESPSQCLASPDGRLLAVGHGYDASVHMFTIDNESGDLASTGHGFVVGDRAFGSVAFLGGLLFVTRDFGSSSEPDGIYSLTVGDDGSLTQNGPIVDTQGIAPTYMAVWDPGAESCAADFDGSGDLTLNDFIQFRNAYTSGDLAADFDESGTLTLNDFIQFRNAYTAGCP